MNRSVALFVAMALLVAHALLLRVGQFRKYRQGQDFTGRALGFGQTPFDVAQRGEALLQMQRLRIIHGGSDLGRVQMMLQFVAATVRHTNRVLIPDMAVGW